MEITRKRIMQYLFCVALVLAGIIFNHYGVGSGEFMAYGSVGNWLIYIGFVGFAVTTLQMLSRKKRRIDERMEFVAAKAMRITYLALIIAAFIIIILDGIQPITIPYHLFMSYLVCGLLLIYFVAYHYLLRRY
ncbi:hypothetical protein DRN67_01605 [Candidatus Micrarchaeota archaeon]|nr:MAG: hypothetical protein DRN67_01605 [Candidatus Micrarchaeota archaeon]